MRKAQMEILGLAIVVVLLLVAVIFFVKFGIQTPSQFRSGFISSELATNLINTFLKTSSDGCSQLSMVELLQDCAQSGGIRCDNGDDSCQYANSTAAYILGQTLSKWNYKYQLIAYYSEPNRPFVNVGEACTLNQNKKSRIFPVPVSSSSMYIKLDICQ